MTISLFSQWDGTTAANNVDLNDIPLTENQTRPAHVNNAFREAMKQLKAGVPGLGSANTFTATQTIESTDAGAGAGPDFALYRNSASPAASDLIGRVLFQGEDSAGNTETYGSIDGQISDPTSTSEDAALLLKAALAGTLTTYMYVGANAAGTATPNAVGLPLGQLSFPAAQNASSDANTLDDYEEGTFTPVVEGTTSAGAGTYTQQTGIYTKIGRVVFIEISTAWSAHTGTGNIVVTGLPFTAAAAPASRAVSVLYSTLTYSGDPTVLITGGTSSLSPRTMATGAATSLIAMDTAATIVFSGFYTI